MLDRPVCSPAAELDVALRVEEKPEGGDHGVELEEPGEAAHASGKLGVVEGSCMTFSDEELAHLQVSQRGDEADDALTEQEGSNNWVVASPRQSTSGHRGKARTAQAARVSSGSVLSGSPGWLRRRELDRTGPGQPDEGGNESSGRDAVLVDGAAENVTAGDLAGRGRPHWPEDWLVEVERSVGPGLVVVAEVLDEDDFEVALEKTSRWSRHSVRAVLTNRSAKAFARGERTGVLIAPIPTKASTASKLAMNFVSQSRIRIRHCRPASSRSVVKVRATWVTQASLGLAVMPRRCTTRCSSSITNST